MTKIWIKGPDPNKQCCGCEGKSGPCSSCCSGFFINYSCLNTLDCPGFTEHKQDITFDGCAFLSNKYNQIPFSGNDKFKLTTFTGNNFYDGLSADNGWTIFCANLVKDDQIAINLSASKVINSYPGAYSNSAYQISYTTPKYNAELFFETNLSQKTSDWATLVSKDSSTNFNIVGYTVPPAYLGSRQVSINNETDNESVILRKFSEQLYYNGSFFGKCFQCFRPNLASVPVYPPPHISPPTPTTIEDILNNAKDANNNSSPQPFTTQTIHLTRCYDGFYWIAAQNRWGYPAAPEQACDTDITDSVYNAYFDALTNGLSNGNRILCANTYRTPSFFTFNFPPFNGTSDGQIVYMPYERYLIFTYTTSWPVSPAINSSLSYNATIKMSSGACLDFWLKNGETSTEKEIALQANDPNAFENYPSKVYNINTLLTNEYTLESSKKQITYNKLAFYTQASSTSWFASPIATSQKVNCPFALP